MNLQRGPLPKPTELSAPHWAAAARGELRVQQCSSCHRHIFPPCLCCPYCGGLGLTWVLCSGRGEIHTYTVVYRPPNPGVEVPYVVAVVTLDEGWHMFSNVVGCPVDSVSIGLPVQVTFMAVSDDLALPMFELVWPMSEGQ
jgi:uncharacterized protein